MALVQQSGALPGPISTETGDRVGFQLRMWEIYLSVTSQPGQLSLAIPPWIETMSNGYREVEFCLTVGLVTRTAGILD